MASINPSFSYTPTVNKAPDTVHSVKIAAMKNGESRCPDHLGVIMMKRKKFGVGTRIVNALCPLCLKKTTKNPDTFQEQLAFLSEQYLELTSNSKSSFREVERLQNEIDSLKDDLTYCKDVDKLETDLFERLLKKALPKIEEMVEKIDGGRSPPTPVEQIRELQENIVHLESKIQSVAGSAKQIVADAIQDVLSQINDAVVSNNNEKFNSKEELNEFRSELDQLELKLMTVKRTMARLPDRVSRNECQIKAVLRNLSTLEDEMEKRAEEYERRFIDIEKRLDIIERQQHNPEKKTVELDLSLLDLGRNPSKSIESTRTVSTSSTSSTSTTCQNLHSKFRQVARDVPLAILESESELVVDFLNSINSDHTGTNLSKVMEIFLILISKPVPSDVCGIHSIVAAIVKEMKNQLDDESVQLYGCVALYFCLMGELMGNLNQEQRAKAIILAISSLDGIELLFGIIVKHEKFHRLQFFATVVLALMSWGKERVALEIVNNSGIDLALAVIVQHVKVDVVTKDDISVIGGAVGLLQMLAIKNPSIRHKMIQKDVKDLAEAMLESNVLNCTRNLKNLIDMLNRPDFWWGTIFKACTFLAKKD